MLIEFSVRNFRSIRETQTFSFAAGTGKERQAENTFDPELPSTPRLLRAAAIYGANAAGKSNLVNTLAFVRDFVQTSASKAQEGDLIPVTPFRLDPETQQDASEFEIVFAEEGVRYQYGFAVTRERVMEEWLYAWPAGKSQRWFQRDYDPEAETYHWHFGPNFRGQKKVLEGATRANALFLSTAVQLNNEQLQPVYRWFSGRLVVIRAHGGFPSPCRDYTVQQCRDDAERQRIVQLLQVADLGIDDLKVETKFVVEEEELPADVTSNLGVAFVNREVHRPLFQHTVGDGESSVSFELHDESDGTQNFFSLAGPWLYSLDKGMVMVMDELDASLHPLLVRFLVSTLHSSETNPHNAQLLFTTHSVTLMEGDLLRRDQIWFVEKGQDRATHLFPLTDFSPRKGEAILRGYLHGRYGALPILRELAH